MNKNSIIVITVLIIAGGLFFAQGKFSLKNLFPTSKTGSTPRQLNKFEEEYYSLAVEMESPELCYKIFPKAYSPSIDGDLYRRSDCLQIFASDQQRPDLCKEVAQGIGERYTEENCRKKIIPGSPTQHLTTWVAAPYPTTTRIQILVEMGYDEKFATEKVNSYYKNTNEFFDFVRSKDFAQRINKLPTFTE